MYDDSYCVIDNVFYSASDGKFRWYDSEAHEWRKLNGLAGLKLRREHGIRLAGFCGDMVVSWKHNVPHGHGHGHGHGYGFRHHNIMTKIWCAEVSLERRRQSSEIWGKVEWLDHVLTLPVDVVLIKVLAVTL